jgi:hypothetical protein
MFLVIGIIIGLVLGLTGSGGSVFAVPLLVLLTGVSMHQAVGLSLATVAASAIFGSIRSKQAVLWLPALLIGVTGMLAAPLGQWFAIKLPESVLTISFAIVAVIIAIKMWHSANQDPQQATITRASDFSDDEQGGVLCRFSPTGQFQLKPRCMGGLIVGGVFIGLLSGLLGVGGGFVIVPLLLALSQVSMQQAVNTSLIIISVISTTGFASYLLLNHASHNALSLDIMLWLAAGGISGMMLGQLLTRKIADDRLQKAFAIGLLLMAITMCKYHFIVESTL